MKGRKLEFGKQKARAWAKQPSKDEYASTQSLLNQAQNTVDIARVQAILADPHCSEEYKDWYKKILVWLQNQNTRMLNKVLSCKIHKTEIRLRMRQKGYEPSPEKEGERKKPRAKPWPKSGLADFLQDPSLLPKKPPGKS